MAHTLARQLGSRRRGFSYLEILAVVTLLGITAAIVLTRVSYRSDEAEINACHLHKGNLEVQAQLWFRDKGSWPASNLSDMAADSNYLPDGLPQCPHSSTPYTFNSSTQKITGHDH
ncbi:MAG: type II secretion system protein [Planctomycetota bacterium]|nr:MAG: type II secretion system protein [Planctomycetota bacterium]REJ98588.1 MAG: type II secretion system protein [Planctomycetota bacterium]REK29888.1 MAG: type II secretion system protein [Planctomycetota bacterium]REK47942.1 MAG: type II secretion system protein [Planctomycetota bacterium]